MTAFDIVQADVMQWCETYTGPKYHALLTDAPFHLTANKGGLVECLGCGAKMARRYRYCHQCGSEMDTEAAKSGFMGKDWDGGMLAFQPELWQALARHLYPGAFVLAFASSRGWPRLGVALEDAGLVYQPDVFVHGVGVVDVPGLVYHITGQSFPKSTCIDTKLDAKAGRTKERERLAESPYNARRPNQGDSGNSTYQQGGYKAYIERPATPLARAWAGHRYGGQILKDMSLSVVTAFKPLTPVGDSSIIVEISFLMEVLLCILLSVHDAESLTSQIHQLLLAGVGSSALGSVECWASPRTASIVASLSGVGQAIIESFAAGNAPTREEISLLGKKLDSSVRDMPTSERKTVLATLQNIVSLWSVLLADIWNLGSTSTIRMVTSSITDLRILRCFLMECISIYATVSTHIDRTELPSLAYTAERTLRELLLMLRPPNTHSVAGTATRPLAQQETDPAANLERNPHNSTIKDITRPVIVAQKPWTGRRLDCIVDTGSGAMNVEAGRVATGANDANFRRDRGLGRSAGGFYGEGTALGKRDKDKITEYHQHAGRWPPNCAFVHHPLCERVTTTAPCPACSGTGGSDGSLVKRQLHVPRWRALATVTCPHCGNEFEHAKEGDELNTTYGIRYVMGVDLLSSVDGSEVKCHECGERFDVEYEPVDAGPLTALVRDRGNSGACGRCGGSGEVEVGAVERVKGSHPGTYKRTLNEAKNELVAWGAGKRPQGHKVDWYNDPDGTEPISRYHCARHCPGCGCWWLSEDADVCPECGGSGEWGCAVRRLGEDSGESQYKRHSTKRSPHEWSGEFVGQKDVTIGYSDKGTAARFFPCPDFSHETAERLALGQTRKYCSKPSRRERDAGLEGMPLIISYRHNHEGRDMTNPSNAMGGAERERIRQGKSAHIPSRNPHPTLKAITLTKWLATLLLPPDIYAPRRLLVPFFGTGSEGIGAALAGWEHVTGIEMSEEYCQIAEARTRFWTGWSAATGETEVKPILKAAKKAQKAQGQTPVPPAVTEPVAEQLTMEV